MNKDSKFYKVDLPSWLSATIAKVESGEEWNTAWLEAYLELKGERKSSGKKSCPMNAARTLFELGYVKGHGNPKRVDLTYVTEQYSKNGTYALLALAIFQENPPIRLEALWQNIRSRYRNETGDEPALSNQGGTTLTYKLWKLGILQT